MKLKEIKAEAKKHGLFVTENSNADHAAKNLLQANNRLLELEAIAEIADDKTRSSKLNAYRKKWCK